MRGVIVRANGEATLIAERPWRVFIPEDAEPFGREFEPAEVSSSLHEIIAAAVPYRSDIEAIAVTGQREGVAFLDGHGEALFASPNVDARASAEGMAIDAARADEVYATTGHLPSLMQAPAKLEWLRTNRTAVAARICHALPLVDWLAVLLTGRYAISRSLAAENGLLDLSSDRAILSTVGERVLAAPDIVPDGTIVGEAGSSALAGLPVVLAGADTQCALAGMGVVAAGEAGMVAGWSAPLQLVTDAAVFDSERRTWTGLHVVPGRSILESNIGEAGRAWEWICSLMAIQPEQASPLAATAPRMSRDVMAVLGRRTMHAAQMTAGIGALTVPLPFVISNPSRADVLRSVLEAIAYASRANLEQLEEVSGSSIGRLHLGGGMSRDRFFAQILADVLDRPVVVAPSPETSALGAAALASVSCRLHASLQAAVDRTAVPAATVEPEIRASIDYEDAYSRWCALADGMERIAQEDA